MARGHHCGGADRRQSVCREAQHRCGYQADIDDIAAGGQQSFDERFAQFRAAGPAVPGHRDPAAPRVAHPAAQGLAQRQRESGVDRGAACAADIVVAKDRFRAGLGGYRCRSGLRRPGRRGPGRRPLLRGAWCRRCRFALHQERGCAPLARRLGRDCGFPDLQPRPQAQRYQQQKPQAECPGHPDDQPLEAARWFVRSRCLRRQPAGDLPARNIVDRCGGRRQLAAAQGQKSLGCRPVRALAEHYLARLGGLLECVRQRRRGQLHQRRAPGCPVQGDRRRQQQTPAVVSGLHRHRFESRPGEDIADQLPAQKVGRRQLFGAGDQSGFLGFGKQRPQPSDSGFGALRPEPGTCRALVGESGQAYAPASHGVGDGRGRGCRRLAGGARQGRRPGRGDQAFPQPAPRRRGHCQRDHQRGQEQRMSAQCRKAAGGVVQARYPSSGG